ncbi:MAG: hypothetical protein EOO22_02465 [Comamonadaceae bacterium]|nr:MAG: hypothetical protein EOO22_02465 [Comamonadaceae bacterium]
MSGVLASFMEVPRGALRIRCSPCAAAHPASVGLGESAHRPMLNGHRKVRPPPRAPGPIEALRASIRVRRSR